MRIFLALAIALLLFSSGCLQRGEQVQQAPAQPANLGLYKGFPDYEPGMWAVYRIFGGARVQLKVVGKETFDGREALGFEMTALVPDASIAQAWFSSSGGLLKYAIKRGDQVTCISYLAQVNTAALPFVGEGWRSTPPEYEGEKEYEEVQSTPKGAKVKVVQFSSPVGEAWVSGEVPFGIVKEIQDGDTIREVYDYGFSGATRDISMDELAECLEWDVRKAVPQYQ